MSRLPIQLNSDERTRLLGLHATTVLAYTKASIKWQALTEKPDTPEYRESKDARERARAQVEIADYQLEQHECAGRRHLRGQAFAPRGSQP